MMASLFAGVSGLKNHQVKMNVIGNNIANINTIGYKTSRVNFQEALVQTFKGAGRPSSVSGGTNPVQLGLGMQVAAIDTLFQQGGLETTGQITDMAIQGSGFFILGDTNGNKFYTRAGAFGFDANANLVDPATGMFVLGKNADSAGQIPSLATTGPITIPFGQQDPARSTEEITLSNNLNASATTSDVVINTVDPGYSGITTVLGTANDGVGGTHSVSITGTQAANDTILGANASAAPMTNSMTLSDIGVTDFTDIVITVDGTTNIPINISDGNMTIENLVNLIDSEYGISAELDASGEILITRDYAGDPGTYNIEISAGAAGNVATQIFGAAIGSTVNSSGGAATTFNATDTFTPNHGTGSASGPFVTTLDLVYNDSGLVVGLDGAGGGGITIEGDDNVGLSATDPDGTGPLDGPLVFETEDTSHSMSIAIFDSLGEKHVLSLEFFKSGLDNRWEWNAGTLDGATISAGGTGYVQFNNDASLGAFSYNGGAQSLSLDPGNGAGLITLDINAGSTNGFDGLTGFASSTSTASIIAQDGYGLGILEKIDIDQVGNISGFFSNGVTRILAQISLADFSNQAGLNKAGLSRYQASANSGEAVEGVAGSTISGSISSGALEASSVDIAQEFTNMITAQRGFQANSRIITTSDSMLDELVNIKR